MGADIFQKASGAIWLPREVEFLLLLRKFENMLSFGEGTEMPIFEGKYAFDEARLFDRGYAELPALLIHAEYKGIAKSFSVNLDRLTSFAELPLQLIYWSARLSVVKHIARYRCGVSPEDGSKDAEPNIRGAIIAVYDEIVATKGAYPLDFSATALGNFLGDRTAAGIGPACEGIEAVLAAMVMASYAAFETLAADLWIAAVNRHHALATNWIGRNSERQLPVNIIAGYGYNVSQSMGTILRDTKKVSFKSLGDIRSAYKQAFNGEIDGVFDPVDDLVKAEKTRHLFAHRGGLIDQKFKADMKDFPEYMDMMVGERVRLIGPVAKSHVTACAKCGTTLLKAVDNWSVGKQ